MFLFSGIILIQRAIPMSSPHQDQDVHPDARQDTRVLVACALIVCVYVLARRYMRKRVVLCDWDLTFDALSTPGSKQVTREVRDDIMKKIGMSKIQENAYMFTLRQFLVKIVQRVFKDNVVFVIVTRNDAVNVRWMLENVVRINPGWFKIVSDKNKTYENKIELVIDTFHTCTDGVWVLVDDSTSEHEKAAAYAKNNCPDITLRHVYVQRPGKGDPYDYQYGLMNQEGALDDFFWATNPWNLM